MESEQVILLTLSFVDLSLTANLLLIVIFAGYENFVSKIHVGDGEDRPAWMGTVDFSGLKIKLIASIVAISAIALLRVFLPLAMRGARGRRAGALAGRYSSDLCRVGHVAGRNGLDRVTREGALSTAYYSNTLTD
jgi:uncharacterized membrane protein YqhA